MCIRDRNFCPPIYGEGDVFPIDPGLHALFANGIVELLDEGFVFAGVGYKHADVGGVGGCLGFTLLWNLSLIHI